MLAAHHGKIAAFFPDGQLRLELPFTGRPAALLPLEQGLLLGSDNGQLELWPGDRLAGESPLLRLEQTPSSPPVSLLAGPSGTLVAGFADGTLGLWSLQNGARLHQEKLHGPVVHLLRRGARLHAASELGDQLTWDLADFERPYCEVLQEVWRSMELVGEAGKAVVRPPDARHRCRN